MSGLNNGVARLPVLGYNSTYAIVYTIFVLMLHSSMERICCQYFELIFCVQRLMPYQCDIDEELILTTARLMKDLGLQVCSFIVNDSIFSNFTLPRKDVGYKHVNLDDCWAEKNRSASGDLLPS